jgi:hypothetical protein
MSDDKYETPSVLNGEILTSLLESSVREAFEIWRRQQYEELDAAGKLPRCVHCYARVQMSRDNVVFVFADGDREEVLASCDFNFGRLTEFVLPEGYKPPYPFKIEYETKEEA